MGLLVLCKTIHFPNSVMNGVGAIIQMFFDHLWSLNKNVVYSFYLCSEIHSVWTLAALILCIFKMKVMPLSSKAPRSEPSSLQSGGLCEFQQLMWGCFPTRMCWPTVKCVTFYPTDFQPHLINSNLWVNQIINKNLPRTINVELWFIYIVIKTVSLLPRRWTLVSSIQSHTPGPAHGLFLFKGVFLWLLLACGHKCLEMIVEDINNLILFTYCQNNMFFYIYTQLHIWWITSKINYEGGHKANKHLSSISHMCLTSPSHLL